MDVKGTDMTDDADVTRQFDDIAKAIEDAMGPDYGFIFISVRRSDGKAGIMSNGETEAVVRTLRRFADSLEAGASVTPMESH